VRAILVVVLSLLSLLLHESHASESAEIPCQFQNGLIWLKVQIPGQPRALDFLLDSGASATVLEVATAERIGLKLGSRLTVQGVGTRATGYHVNKFVGRVAGIPLASKVLALDLSSVSRACGRRIDGLVGSDFFEDRIVQIDFERQALRLLTRSQFPTSGCEVLPLAVRRDAICTQVGVAGQSGEWMRIDTGFDSTLRWVAKRTKLKALHEASVAFVSGSALSMAADIQLGSIAIPRVKIGVHAKEIFAGESGLLGNGLLSRFIVTFDLPGKRLLLARR